MKHDGGTLLTHLSQLPNCCAVYAMYGGDGGRRYVAYVGIADKLKRRIAQHLLSRDSTVATGTSAVGINPEYIKEIRWWTHDAFAERNKLEAAELVAFDVLNPALRSRRSANSAATKLYCRSRFKVQMEKLFAGKAHGRLTVVSLEDVINKVSVLEKRLMKLEREMA